MNLFLYNTATGQLLLRIRDVLSYTADRVVAADGVYSPLAEDTELSSLEDCSETLRADWRAANPSPETRIEELEALVAGLLFGGECV